MIETAVGGFRARARAAHGRARRVRRASAIASASPSATSSSGTPTIARSRWTARAPRALAARAAFRELQNPRGEAACERLLAMIAIDTDDFARGQGARASSRRSSSTGCRTRGASSSRSSCSRRSRSPNGDARRGGGSSPSASAIVLDEAEPRQHRHLTHAWLAQSEQRGATPPNEIDRARAAFGDKARCGDHTPQLLKRFVKLAGWAPRSRRSTRGSRCSSARPRARRLAIRCPSRSN